MKVIAIILFVLQALSLFGSIANGTVAVLLEDLFAFNGIYGYGHLIGFFLPTIIGVILLVKHEKKEQAKTGTNTADLAKDPASSWKCANCKTANRNGVQICQKCGVSKAWSDSKR